MCISIQGWTIMPPTLKAKFMYLNWALVSDSMRFWLGNGRVKKKREVIFTTIKAIPPDEAIWAQLNYRESLDSPKESKPIFQKFHRLHWVEIHQINPYFRFQKFISTLPDFGIPREQFQVVFYDAFAHRKHSEL